MKKGKGERTKGGMERERDRERQRERERETETEREGREGDGGRRDRGTQEYVCTGRWW